jgi:hypothetical protein
LAVPSPTAGDQALRKEPTIVLISSRLLPPRLLTPWRGSGRSRTGLENPSHSPPTRGARASSFPVAAVLKPPDTEKVITRRAGNSRVLRLTDAPLKSPNWSGVKVLEVVTPSSKPAGKRSRGTTLRSGSGLGSRVPFSDVVV